MAYSDAQWEKARVMMDAGHSLAEISKETGIKDRSSISKRAKTEGWTRGGEIQHLVEKKVKAKLGLAYVEEEIQQRTTVEKAVVEFAVEERLRLEGFFKSANLLIVNTVVKKIKKDTEDGASPSYQDLNAAANAVNKSREGVLGKAPEVVINNQNTVAAAATVEMTDGRFREVVGNILDTI